MKYAKLAIVVFVMGLLSGQDAALAQTLLGSEFTYQGELKQPGWQRRVHHAQPAPAADRCAIRVANPRHLR